MSSDRTFRRMGWNLLLTTAASALLLGASGCSFLIVASATGSDPSKFEAGATREAIEAELGTPIASRNLPDGSRLETYEYRQQHRGGTGTGGGAIALGMLWLDVASFFLAEGIFTPLALYGLSQWPRHKVEIIYGPDGRLLAFGPLPAYGAGDESVAVETRAAIKAGCRTQDPAELPPAWTTDAAGLPLRPEAVYEECVQRRVAIWGAPRVDSARPPASQGARTTPVPASQVALDKVAVVGAPSRPRLTGRLQNWSDLWLTDVVLRVTFYAGEKAAGTIVVGGFADRLQVRPAGELGLNGLAVAPGEAWEFSVPLDRGVPSAYTRVAYAVVESWGAPEETPAGIRDPTPAQP